MRSTSFLPALVAVVAALPAPAPQEINLDLFANIPTPTSVQVTGVPTVVTFDTKALLASATAASSISVAITDAAPATASIVKRAACAAQPSGYGPITTNPKDDAASFVANAVYANAANSAAVPSGYSQTFKNLNASSQAYGYMGFTNLREYNPQTCATKCNAIKGCMGINIYFERDPSLAPDANQCPNPASLTQIKCVYWGGPVTVANTKNFGTKSADFQIVAAGSNGYVNQNIAAPSGYSDANFLGNAAINAPYDALGYNTFIGSKVFASGPFNATLCTEACNAQNVYNLAHPPADGSPVQTCQFVNTYILSKNSKTALGQYCAMYSQNWASKYATNTGSYSGNDRYTVGFSYSFYNLANPGSPNPAAAIAQAKEEISVSTLQSYCSTFLGYNDLNAYFTATTTKTPVSTVTATTTLKVKASSSAGSSSSSSKAASVSKRAVASVATPAALTKYPASILSSACSAVVTGVSKTATITVSTATVTAATSKSTVFKTVTTTTR
ncbi:hypothetical protein E4T44_03884 [Aureobasidium sp. EXF-8845]|nr:hypothetical protein E4T44_03884 [Aureobasidium sp. EXF-8845]KAI4854353.1 hypothetical protein E4T45_03992 [Aureobasidium sp. EXF-8846]